MTPGWNLPWTEEENAWVLENPGALYVDFRTAFPNSTRTNEAFAGHRKRMLRRLGKSEEGKALRLAGKMRHRPNTRPDMPPLQWDKAESDFSWREMTRLMRDAQEIAKRASGSQDRAHFHIETNRPAAVIFLSDWHFGSWGTDYTTFERVTDLILENKLWMAVLGDMIQMSIKLRNVLEISDNLLPPRLQHRGIASWLEEVESQVLWSTWDNHAVMREEAASGFSQYAELFREKVVYHSGIGHVDLAVGNETYRIATSHRFRGNSYLNPTHGQMRYGRMEGQDREIIVAGDSHTPAVTHYADGGTPKLAINCGTLQTDSGYAKRHFAMNTLDWMPVVEFSPDPHLWTYYPTIDHYLFSLRRDRMQV
jgi:hypothetical protein